MPHSTVSTREPCMGESLAERYAASIDYLARAEAVIPLGSQTFSKSRTQYPVGAAPLFAARSQGSHTWDIDGNEYVDLVCSLGAVSLGYGDPEINEAVMRQIQDGVTLSLAHPIEAEVAERLVNLVPCAESVRFAKNGTDATSASIRLARAFTGRERVIVCGYHGWQDWYIGSTSMHRGVPERTRSLTHAVPYNDLGAIEAVLAEYPDEVAALIMEPMTSTWPEPRYLEGVREVTDRHGVVMVFDEMLTGFRFAEGGAQQYFGVTPDLAAFGKALSNGFPLSAIVGRKDILGVMPSIFFSGTFGGETLSLAAARVVLDRYATGEPIRQLAEIGSALTDQVEAARPEASRTFLSFSGHPAWLFQQWHLDDPEVLAQAKTLFLQEMLRRGILVLNTHEVTTAHTDADIEAVAQAY
ncbi:MAG: aminotransferase class III-fold pyridoxal phosphate-dependent enzyme, partial [Actinomycetales bacterium]|nr:aminotransferase class III-fold pyridoxal phosphate-dependent enzyme [Actinomycetales bacterium]